MSMNEPYKRILIITLPLISVIEADSTVLITASITVVSSMWLNNYLYLTGKYLGRDLAVH